jgi:hypothetical protein
MLKFIVNRDTIVLDTNIILLEEFSDIIKFGVKKKSAKLATSSLTELSNSMLLYIYLCCDLSEENPMKDVDFRQKPQQALSRAFKDKNRKFSKEEQVLIDAGMDAYNYFNETAAERSEIAMDKKIDEARSMLETTLIEVVRNVNPQTGVVSYASNESIITKIAQQINEMMSLKLTMKQTAMKIQSTSRVKGNKGSSLIERGTFTDIITATVVNDDEQDS